MKSAKRMTKYRFDAVIKKNLIESGRNSDEFGYQFPGDNRMYENYYSTGVFAQFVDEMKTQYKNHFDQYFKGKGSELVPKSYLGRMTPPKMASVASSSRFCYLALRDGTDCFGTAKPIPKEDVLFEKECRIFEKSGTAPQLDAYISTDASELFVEVKCHEIFDQHTVEFKHAYFDVLNSYDCFKGLVCDVNQNASVFTLDLKLFDFHVESTRFDIKQLICHLLGIANHTKGKKSKLIYLFFKPICSDSYENDLINTVFKELKQEIQLIFNSNPIREFCKMHHIELQAFALESKVMEQLTCNNVIDLLEAGAIDID